MTDWSITHEETGVFRLRFSEHLSTEVARAALTELAHRITCLDDPSILIADLRAVRRIDAGAPVAGALLFSAAVSKTEHVYVLVKKAVVRSAAAAAASSIGLRFTCLEDEPDPATLRSVPFGKQL